SVGQPAGSAYSPAQAEIARALATSMGTYGATPSARPAASAGEAAAIVKMRMDSALSARVTAGFGTGFVSKTRTPPAHAARPPPRPRRKADEYRRRRAGEYAEPREASGASRKASHEMSSCSLRTQARAEPGSRDHFTDDEGRTQRRPEAVPARTLPYQQHH